MGERERIDDLAELGTVALRALTDALHDGDGKHPAGSWKDESVGNQINHAVKHLQAFQQPSPNDTEGHLQHLICRAVMALALRNAQER